MTQGWVTKRLGDVAKTQYGLSESMNEHGMGFKIFRMGEVQNGRLIDTGRMKFADISRQEFEQYKLQSGDVLFNRTNSFELVGKTGIFSLKGNYCFASYLVRLNLDRKQVVPEFMNYFMNSARFQKSVKEKASKSINQANINATILSNELICFPESLAEQRRIVGILDEAFAAIATARANTEKNLQNIRELFDRQLLQLVDRPSHSCRALTLAEVSKVFSRGKSRHRPRNEPSLYGGPYPFIQTGDVRNSDHIIEEYSQTYSELGLAQSRLWPKGTVCITIAANIAETGILSFDSCFPDSMIGVIVDNSVAHNEYVEYMLRAYKSRLQAAGKGSAQDNINMATFEQLRLPFPSVEEQRRLVPQLNAMRENCRQYELLSLRKLLDLDALKQSLLHHAFTCQL